MTEDNRSLAEQLRLQSLAAIRAADLLDQGRPLDALDLIAKAGDELKELEVLAIGQAHEAGASWAVIGAKLGISRQSAHERFTREVRNRLQ